MTRHRVLLSALVASLTLTSLGAQAPQQPVLDRLPSLPGYAQFAKMQDALRTGGPAFVSGALNVTWVDEGKAFTYAFGGKLHRFDTATNQAVVTGDAPVPAGAGRGGGQGRGGRGAAGAAPGICPPEQVDRGRQATCVASPDGKFKALYRHRNLWVANADGSNERQVTTDGDEGKRIKYGTGSWVYGEELNQTSAIWWAPDSSRVAFYRFDESPVKDFYLQMTQTQVQSSLDVEAYPKAGAPNPIADILVYDVASSQRRTLDVRDGQPFTDIPADGSKFTNDNVGHYVYNVRWSRDGSGELKSAHEPPAERPESRRFTDDNAIGRKGPPADRTRRPSTGWLTTSASSGRPNGMVIAISTSTTSAASC
jgi:dipeptidyl-peptidase-4